MSKLSKYFKLSLPDKLLVVEALLLLAAARLAIVGVSFKRVASFLGRRSENVEAGDEPANSNTASVKRIAWAIRRVGLVTPWRSNCLAKAIAAQVMLRRRGIAAALYFGMVKNSDGEYAAHAWLTSGGVVLTQNPQGKLLGGLPNLYITPDPTQNKQLAPESIDTTVTVAPTGGSQPFGIRSPYLGLNLCIALEGIFPSRN